MTIQPIKSFAKFVDKTGSTTIGLCKNAKTKTDAFGTQVKTFAKNQADKFVKTKPAQFVGKNKVADKAINGAKTLADDIAKFVEPKLAKVKPAIDGVIKKVKDSKVVKAVSNFFGKAVNFVKARMGKFNPDLAPAAEKAAETFNNFVR